MKTLTFLEPLEDRIAPAAMAPVLHGTNLVTYTEADGDAVTVKFSKAVFAGDNADHLNDVFVMDNTTGALKTLDFSKLGSTDEATSAALGTDILFTVKKAKTTGDGVANVGEIDSPWSIGAVKVAGNLGAVNTEYGDSNFGEIFLAVKSISAASMVNDADTASVIKGDVGTIAIKGNVTHTIFEIGGEDVAPYRVSSVTVGGNWTASTLAVGLDSHINGVGGPDGLFGTADDREVDGSVISSIGSLTIGGHIVAGSGSTNYGIEAGSFGKVVVGKVVVGKVDHTTEFNTIAVYTPLALTDITDPAGGGVFAVHVMAANALVDHTLVSANVVTYHEADGDLVTVKFSKALFTGDNADDFENVFSFDTDTGALNYIELNALTDGQAADGIGLTLTVKKGAFGDGVAGDIQYLATHYSFGAITTPGNLESITVDNADNDALALKSLTIGSMNWDNHYFGSSIFGNVGTVTIKGDFTDNQFSVTGSVQALTVNGDILDSNSLGGVLNDVNDDIDNSIYTGFHLGSAKTITVGNIIGSAENGSAQLNVDGDVGTITTGDITGSAGKFSGQVTISGTVTTAKLGSITGGGGAGPGSGGFYAGQAGSITAASITTNSGAQAGIGVGGDTTSITITGNVDGTGNYNTLLEVDGNLKTLTIGGSVTSARIYADNFGDIKISGTVSTTQDESGFYAATIKSLSALGFSGDANHHLNIDAYNYDSSGYTLAGATIGSITVTGDVSYTDIMIGTNLVGSDAKLTSVNVKGAWTASSLNVGISAGLDGIFYTSDDFLQGTSHVGALTIKGAISGTDQAGENYGIRADVFDKLVLGKTTIDAIATYAANTPIPLSPESDGTPGNGAVFIQRGVDPAGGSTGQNSF